MMSIHRNNWPVCNMNRDGPEVTDRNVFRTVHAAGFAVIEGMLLRTCTDRSTVRPCAPGRVFRVVGITAIWRSWTVTHASDFILQRLYRWKNTIVQRRIPVAFPVRAKGNASHFHIVARIHNDLRDIATTQTGQSM
jgi:hypothetical protein